MPEKKDYKEKARSYMKLKELVERHRNYRPTNEWGCHELTALFYEVVILSKMFLDKKKMAHDSHRSIMNSLKEVDNDLRVAYKTLLDFSRDIRYERLSITEKMREDFLKAYYSFKVRIQNVMG